MTAYVMIRFTPRDQVKLSQYAASVPSTLLQYCGEVMVKGPLEQLHGKADYSTQVIVAFPSREKATQWYCSEEYQALIPIRDAGMDSQFQLIG